MRAFRGFAEIVDTANCSLLPWGKGWGWGLPIHDKTPISFPKSTSLFLLSYFLFYIPLLLPSQNLQIIKITTMFAGDFHFQYLHIR